MEQGQIVFKYSLVEVIICSVVVIIASFFTYKFGMEKLSNESIETPTQVSSNTNVTNPSNTQIQAENMPMNSSMNSSIDTMNSSMNTSMNKLVNIPTATPDLSDLDFDLPNMKGIAEDLLLYEGGDEILRPEEREYGKIFDVSTTRFVQASLVVRAYDAGEYDYIKVVYYFNNSILEKCSSKSEIKTLYESTAMETDSKGRSYRNCNIFLPSCGSKEAGNWRTGIGRVEVKHQGRNIISKEFILSQ